MRKFSWGIRLFVSLLVIGFVTGSLTVRFGNDLYVVVDEVDYHLDDSISHSGFLWISPYFSLKQYINTALPASQQIVLQTYDFTHASIKDRIKDLAHNGVQVRAMVENEKYKQFYDSFGQLINYFVSVSGVVIQSDEGIGSTFLHAKYIVWDSGYIIQTANLTKSAFTNREFFRVGYDSGVRTGLLHIFDKDWHGEPLTPHDIHQALLVCPVNCRSGIEHLLENAQRSIWIDTQYIADDSILNILKDKTTLDLKVILADTDDNEGFLDYFGPIHAKYLPKPYNHSKTFLVDNRYLVIGSINLSANSMDNNRELSIIITDSQAITTFKQQFMQDRRVSHSTR